MNSSDALEQDGVTIIRGIRIERWEQPIGAGWAIFSGCDGEEAFFELFIGADSDGWALKQAELLLASTLDDGEEEVAAVFDGCVCAAYLLPTGELIAANAIIDSTSITALAEAVGAKPEEWGKIEDLNDPARSDPAPPGTRPRTVLAKELCSAVLNIDAAEALVSYGAVTYSTIRETIWHLTGLDIGPVPRWSEWRAAVGAGIETESAVWGSDTKKQQGRSPNPLAHRA